MDCDAKPRYLGARRLSLSWTRQELCDTVDHIIQGLLFIENSLVVRWLSKKIRTNWIKAPNFQDIIFRHFDMI